MRTSELAEQLVELTDGNAFLVGEVWRHMLDQEAVAGGPRLPTATIPESVREVMADRVAGLTPALGELLQLIAVSPRGIALPVLRAAAQMDDEPLLGALDEGLHTGMLDEIRDASLVYRVRHELLRRTVYERLSSFRAAALHLRVGEALEAMPEGRRDRIVNELAFHFRAAAPIAGNGRAVEYALDAAAQAERSLAFAEAAARFEEALALGVPDLPAEAEVRCRQGLAWHLAGRPAEALESFAAAAAAARECGDEALQARAAIGFETACWRPGIDDPRAVALLREAALGIAAEPSAQRVRVLAHLSRALAYRREHAAAGECWSQAVAMARLVGDPGALMVALSHAAWTRGSRALDEILADLTEAGELARTLPHDHLSDVDQGHAHRAADRGLRHRRGPRGERRAPRAVRARRAALPRAGRRAARRALRALRRPARRRRSGREPQRRDRPADRGGPLRGARDPDVQHPPRAGTTRRDRARGPPHRVGADGGRQRLAAGARRAARRDRRRRGRRAASSRRSSTPASGPSSEADSASAD